MGGKSSVRRLCIRHLGGAAAIIVAKQLHGAFRAVSARSGPSPPSVSPPMGPQCAVLTSSGRRCPRGHGASARNLKSPGALQAPRPTGCGSFAANTGHHTRCR
eukprot:16437578-Heterocapsa_arctica.AAC.2